MTSSFQLSAQILLCWFYTCEREIWRLRKVCKLPIFVLKKMGMLSIMTPVSLVLSNVAATAIQRIGHIIILNWTSNCGYKFWIFFWIIFEQVSKVFVPWRISSECRFLKNGGLKTVFIHYFVWLRIYSLCLTFGCLQLYLEVYCLRQTLE